MPCMDKTSEVGTLRLLVILTRRRRLIAITTLAVMLLTGIIVFVIPVHYAATAVILAPQSSQSSISAILGQLGGNSTSAISSMLPEGLDINLRNIGETYVGILSSR